MGQTNGLFRELQERKRAYDAVLTLLREDAGYYFRGCGWGSTRPRPGDADYDQAEWIGMELAKNGIDIFTGGGPGIMEALNQGCKKGRAATSSSARSMAATLELPNERPNGFLDLVLDTHDFGTRLDMFRVYGTCFFCLKGGDGTDLERAYATQLIQLFRAKGHGLAAGTKFAAKCVDVGYCPKLYLVGRDFYDYVRIKDEVMVRAGTITPADAEVPIFVDNVEELLTVILAERENWRAFLRSHDVQPQN